MITLSNCFETRPESACAKGKTNKQTKTPREILPLLHLKLESEISETTDKLRVAETSAYKARYVLATICSVLVK